MRPFALPALGLLMAWLPLTAQEPATTDSGKRVLLYPDGTWKPEPTSPLANRVGGDYQRSKAATMKIPLNRGLYALYINPAKWKRTDTEDAGKMTFQHRSGDGYAMVITERMEVPMDTLKEAALANARKVAPDAVISEQETRIVNGRELLMMKIRGTIKGLKFQYFGYYHSGPEGAVQVLTYTSQNLADEYEKEFLEFLNGVVLAP